MSQRRKKLKPNFKSSKRNRIVYTFYKLIIFFISKIITTLLIYKKDAKRAKKEKDKRRADRNILRDEEGNVVLDENGQPITMDDPELLAALLEDEDDEDMKKYLQKKTKKTKKKKKGKVKKEKVDAAYEENINPEMFADTDGFGWKKKDAAKKMFKPKSLKKAKDAMETDQDAEIQETEEEAARRAAREAGIKQRLNLISYRLH